MRASFIGPIKPHFPRTLPARCHTLRPGYKNLPFEDQLGHIALELAVNDDTDVDDIDMWQNPDILRAYHKMGAQMERNAEDAGFKGTTPNLTPAFIQSEIGRLLTNPNHFFRPGLYLHRLHIQLKIRQSIADSVHKPSKRKRAR